MAVAVDPLLNDTVNLYIQAVDYRRISTSQILAPTLKNYAGMRRRPAIIAGFRWYYARFQPDYPESSWNGRILDQMAGDLYGFYHSGRICPFWLNLQPVWLGSCRYGWDRAKTTGFPVYWPRFGRFVPDSSHFCRNPMHQIFEKYFYIILL
jgi:hypothetical protein